MKIQSSLFVITTLAAFSLSALAAKTVENRTVYDFAQTNVNAYGIYKPTTETKNGLQAELEARKEGIRFATEQLQKECGDESKFVEGWKTSFKSLGSVIYPKGVLEIELISSLKDIFVAYKNAKVQTPKNAEGDLLILKLPPVASSQVSCGTLKLKADAQTTVHIVPIALTQSDAPLKTVTLTLQDGALVVPSSETALTTFLKEQLTKGKGTDKAPLALAISTK